MANKVTYVNHTFTSHLALVASLQPFAGIEEDVICEYPVEPKQLALDITTEHLLPDANGQINVPERPGFGVGAKQKRAATLCGGYRNKNQWAGVVPHANALAFLPNHV